MFAHNIIFNKIKQIKNYLSYITVTYTQQVFLSGREESRLPQAHKKDWAFKIECHASCKFTMTLNTFKHREMLRKKWNKIYLQIAWSSPHLCVYKRVCKTLHVNSLFFIHDIIELDYFVQIHQADLLNIQNYF